MIALTWYGCDFPSGRITAELPGASASGTLSRRLGAYSTLSLSLDLSARTPGWIAATQPGRSLIVGCLDDTPVWAGIVLPRTRGSAPTSSPSATTAEGYLERRYTPDLTITGDLSTIAAALLAPVAATVPCLDIATTPTGITTTRTYADADDKTVMSNLTELMGLDGGPEFTIDPAWAPDRTGFRLTARIAPRIGSTNPGPTATFDYPGPVMDYQQGEDYGDGKGATVVRASGAGEGADRAVSDTLTSPYVAAGWPIYEYRWSPGSDITDTTVLNSHAAAAVPLMQGGASTWTLTAALAEAPHLGIDWTLGDQIRLLVQPGTSPGHPDGADITARVWGWDLDPAAETVSPVLVEES